MAAERSLKWQGHMGIFMALLVFVPWVRVEAFGIPEFLEFGECASTKIQPDLDLSMYSGMWFAQEMVPNEYSQISSCSMTNYTWKGDLMTVVERGLSLEGRKVRQNSLIRPVEDGYEGEMTVDAEGVPSAPYEVISTDYENYACVHSCMSFMGFRAAFSWIYTRKAEPDRTYVALCRDVFSEQGVDPTPLQPVKQGKDCPYMDKMERIMTYTETVLKKAKAKAQEEAKLRKVAKPAPAEETVLEEVEEQHPVETESGLQEREELLLRELEEERQRQEEELMRLEEERQRQREERRRMEEERQREEEERRRLEDERQIMEEERTRLEEERVRMEEDRKEEKEEITELREEVRSEIRRNHRGGRRRTEQASRDEGHNSSSHLHSNIATTLLSLAMAAILASL